MFNVYITSLPYTPKDKVDEDPLLSLENKSPLGAKQAMDLARECSGRALVGYVRVVDIAEDSTVFEWHFNLGVVFPPIG
jgi:hypothetical protein